jgi:hypothetical protein
MKLSNLLAVGSLALSAAFSAHAQQNNDTPGSPNATTTIDDRYLPAPPQKFEGEINLNAAQSKPAWECAIPSIPPAAP